MEAMEEPLHVLAPEFWPHAIDIFAGDQAYMARTIIKAQIYNINNIPNIDVKAYIPYRELEEGIVFVWRLCSASHEIYAFSNKDDKSKLASAIENTRHIDWNSPLLFSCMLPEMQIVINSILDKKGFSYSKNKTSCAKCTREKALEYDIQLPPDVRLETLGVEHAEEIDEVWPHRYPGSVDYFVGMLGRGLALGIVGKSDGILRGWILRSVQGDLHALQVKTEYRRNGYAELLVKTLSKAIAERNSDVFGLIMAHNTPSMNLFNKLEFDVSTIIYWMFCTIKSKE